MYSIPYAIHCIRHTRYRIRILVFTWALGPSAKQVLHNVAELGLIWGAVVCGASLTAGAGPNRVFLAATLLVYMYMCMHMQMYTYNLQVKKYKFSIIYLVWNVI